MARHLNDTARTLLAAAAARTDLRALPTPETIKVDAATVETSLQQMIGAGFLAEVAAAPEDAVWRQTDEDGKSALVVTPAGLAAIGIEDEGVATPPDVGTKKPGTPVRPGKAARGRAKAKAADITAPKSPQGERRVTSGERAARTSKPASSRAGGQSKQDICIALLRRGNGASIAELMKATDWQAHSVRGFMSGALKKRLGIEIVSTKDETSGERRYHIAALRAKDEQE